MDDVQQIESLDFYCHSRKRSQTISVSVVFLMFSQIQLLNNNAVDINMYCTLKAFLNTLTTTK